MFMSAIKDLRQFADRLPGQIDKLDAELRDVLKRMTALQKAGLIYASEHWREDKYLYLIYPMQDGARRREYIGADADRTAAARAGIERGKEFDTLAAKRRALEASAVNGARVLQEAARVLQSW
jgi:hypothetical protein